MAAMLTKFCIDYSDVIVITDIVKKPQEATHNWFDNLVKDFVKNANGQGKMPVSFSSNIGGNGRPSCFNISFRSDARITESELLALRDKTNRHMRLREQLLVHSKTSNLIVM